MSVLVVGSIAYDSVTTPHGSREDAVGGSAVYFAHAASFFAPVSVVAVVGEDFVADNLDAMQKRGVDISGVAKAKGKTFRWAGEYHPSMNARATLDTQLNVFADFAPKLSPQHSACPYLFLANIAPELQLDVLRQMDRRPKLVALDSMNFWIDSSPDALREVVAQVDVLFLEEAELRDFAQERNIVRAAKRVQAMGPATVVAKRGEYGALMFHDGDMFSAPAYPLERVMDPTGAGDAFAAGFVGCLAARGDLSPDAFRRAAILGSVMGSFCVQDFSIDRLTALNPADIDARYRAFTNLAVFPQLPSGATLAAGPAGQGSPA